MDGDMSIHIHIPILSHLLGEAIILHRISHGFTMAFPLWNHHETAISWQDDDVPDFDELMTEMDSDKAAEFWWFGIFFPMGNPPKTWGIL